ncbi:hypothetical protein Q4O60_02025 [Aeribacillus pallidus]|nr:hypothetical protein [Aeribacillus pallidus]
MADADESSSTSLKVAEEEEGKEVIENNDGEKQKNDSKTESDVKENVTEESDDQEKGEEVLKENVTNETNEKEKEPEMQFKMRNQQKKIVKKKKDKEKPLKKVENQIDNDFIKNNLKIGMSQEKVKNLLGEPKAIGTSAMESHKVWRHGYVTKEGYVFGEQKDFQEMGIRYGG